MNDHRITFIVAIILLFASIGVALVLGRFQIGFGAIWDIIVTTCCGNEAEPKLAASSLVLWSVRFPRVLAAIMVGAALSVAGAVFQSLFRNPLVSPAILGVTSGASFGATLAFFFAANSALVVEGSAFVFGLLAVTLAYQDRPAEWQFRDQPGSFRRHRFRSAWRTVHAGHGHPCPHLFRRGDPGRHFNCASWSAVLRLPPGDAGEEGRVAKLRGYYEPYFLELQRV